MKIDTQQLSALIDLGAQRAYELNNPKSKISFDDWLGAALQESLQDGMPAMADHLHRWCEQVCEGQTDTHYADLPLEEQRSISVAREVFKTISDLDRASVISANHCTDRMSRVLKHSVKQ